MGAYAELIKLVLALAICVAVGLFGRSCGKAAGLEEGADARKALQDEVGDLTSQLNGCITSVNFANSLVSQAADEAERQRGLAAAAAARALLAEQEGAARAAVLEKQLRDARKHPDAAAQLDMVMHPSIPLR